MKLHILFISKNETSSFLTISEVDFKIISERGNHMCDLIICQIENLLL